MLMITAWMLLISVSLILARFYKPAFPNNILCGVQVWFAVSVTQSVIRLYDVSARACHRARGNTLV